MRGSEYVNTDVPDGYKSWLACECGFALERGVVAYPKCPDCGKHLHIHSNGALCTRIWPKHEIGNEQPVKPDPFHVLSSIND
jgi:hypothetical protein